MSPVEKKEPVCTWCGGVLELTSQGRYVNIAGHRLCSAAPIMNVERHHVPVVEDSENPSASSPVE